MTYGHISQNAFCHEAVHSCTEQELTGYACHVTDGIQNGLCKNMCMTWQVPTGFARSGENQVTAQSCSLRCLLVCIFKLVGRPLEGEGWMQRKKYERSRRKGPGCEDGQGQGRREEREAEPTCQNNNICFLQGSTAVLPDMERVVAAQQPPRHPPQEARDS